jgi:hypothetical protein
MGFIQSKFTWCNNKEDVYFIKERLDQVVANAEWCENFGEVDVFILASRSLDHSPLLVYEGERGV